MPVYPKKKSFIIDQNIPKSKLYYQLKHKQIILLFFFLLCTVLDPQQLRTQKIYKNSGFILVDIVLIKNNQFQLSFQYVGIEIVSYNQNIQIKKYKNPFMETGNQSKESKVVNKKKNVKVVEGIPYYLAQQEQIGKGCFGKVVRVYNKEDYNQQLVAKIIPLQNIELIQSMKSQVQVLKELPYHQNLVNCKKLQICTENNFYLIMQYCNGGSFEKYIVENINISQDKIWDFLKQFCRGYQVLYDNQIVHRDIKPDNILIHNGIFKIADFGLAQKFTKNQKSRIATKGTPVYMAPQLIFGSATSNKIDVFSLGVVLFRLAFNGKFPYGNNFPSTLQYVEKLPKLTIQIPKEPERSPQLKNILYSMLQKKPDKRISWQQIFEHPKVAINEYEKTQNKDLTQQQMAQLDKAMDKLGQQILSVRRVSIAQINYIPQRKYSRTEISQHTTNLMELEMFMTSSDFKEFQIVIWKGKILHLAISYVITKIKNILIKIQFDKHIKSRLNASIKLGYLFAYQILFMMKQQISIGLQQNLGLNPVVSMIEGDQNVIISQLKKIGEEQPKQNMKLIRNEYPQHLYKLITQYWQFTLEVKESLRKIISILADIYDSGLRFFQKQFSNEETNQLDMIPCKNFRGFSSYLHNKQKVTFEVLQKSFKRLGLLFL